jgi:hypothetical protein
VDDQLERMSGENGEELGDKGELERQQKDQRSLTATMNHMAMNVACNTVVVGTRPVMLVMVSF